MEVNTLVSKIEYIFYAKSNENKTMAEISDMLHDVLYKEINETYSAGIRHGLNKSVQALNDLIKTGLTIKKIKP